MMRSKMSCLILISCVVILTSCLRNESSPITFVTQSPTTEMKMSSVEMTATGNAATPVSTFTARPTWTPVPTEVKWIELPVATLLVTPEVQSTVATLLKDNGKCKFPCWWGITPGKTTEDDVFEILIPLSSRVVTKGDTNSGNFLIQFYFLVPGDKSKAFPSIITIDNHVVNQIEFSQPDTSTSYRFQDLYDEKSFIFLRGYNFLVEGGYYFELFLINPQQGLLASFILDGKDAGDYIQLCPKSLIGQITLLQVNENTKVEEILQMSPLLRSKPGFPPILTFEKAVNENQKTIHLDQSGCFITPKNLWP